jgi:hypothetical protein
MKAGKIYFYYSSYERLAKEIEEKVQRAKTMSGKRFWYLRNRIQHSKAKT